jgi:hypothetical protein
MRQLDRSLPMRESVLACSVLRPILIDYPGKHGRFAVCPCGRCSPRADLQRLAATLACPVALAIQSAQQAATTITAVNKNIWGETAP